MKTPASQTSVKDVESTDRLTQHIQRIVDAAPPLSPEQYQRLAQLLAPTGVMTP